MLKRRIPGPLSREAIHSGNSTVNITVEKLSQANDNGIYTKVSG
jgi:hypothetical protein